MLRQPSLTTPGAHASRFGHPKARVYTQAIDGRSVNAKGWPGTQEAETGKAKDDSCLAFSKGNGGLNALTEEEVSTLSPAGLNPAQAVLTRA